MVHMKNQTQVPDVSGLTVMNMEGDVVQLESLWKSRQIVLTFLRHFG